MTTSTVYSVEIQQDTRNHKGSFVPEEVYRLVEITESGWALICPNSDVCHYVDPENVHEAYQSCFL